MATALLLTLLMALQQSPTPPDRAPYDVVIVDGESTVDMTYDPRRDQGKLRAPARWCQTARRNEPLVKDAREIASGKDYPGMLAMNHLPKVSPSSVRVIRDETTCSAAAKVFDGLWFGGGNADRETHTTFEPVLVVEVGSMYLVGLRREPNEPFVVMVLDQQMNEIGSYGEGL